MPLKLSNLRSDFTLTLGHLNLALNNLAQILRVKGLTASSDVFAANQQTKFVYLNLRLIGKLSRKTKSNTKENSLQSFFKIPRLI